MEIILDRTLSNKTAQVGEITMNGRFYDFTLEDVYRGGNKIDDITGIPPGRYEIKSRKVGGMNDRYSGQYAWHQGMLHLQDVPNYTNVYIHIGNTEDSTSGCVLVGRGVIHDHTNDTLTLVHSTQAYKRIALLCYDCFDAGEKVWITIQ